MDSLRLYPLEITYNHKMHLNYFFLFSICGRKHIEDVTETELQIVALSHGLQIWQLSFT